MAEPPVAPGLGFDGDVPVDDADPRRRVGSAARQAEKDVSPGWAQKWLGHTEQDISTLCSPAPTYQDPETLGTVSCAVSVLTKELCHSVSALPLPCPKKDSPVSLPTTPTQSSGGWALPAPCSMPLSWAGRKKDKTTCAAEQSHCSSTFSTGGGTCFQLNPYFTDILLYMQLSLDETHSYAVYSLPQVRNYKVFK